jgi:hypothetical protein
MNLSNKLKIKGEVSFKVTDKEGNVKEWSQPNLVTNEGLGFFASKIFDRKSRAFENAGSISVIPNTDTINYYIGEIAIGTDSTAASKSDTFYNTVSKGEKLRKPITNMALNENDKSFYYQINLRALPVDTLSAPITEVLLIAKSDYPEGTTSVDTIYDSPTGSILNPKKLICRTTLQQPFEKYETDRVSIAWKIRLG